MVSCQEAPGRDIEEVLKGSRLRWETAREIVVVDNNSGSEDREAEERAVKKHAWVGAAFLAVWPQMANAK